MTSVTESEVLSIGAPVQVRGMVGDRVWYFRARYDAWQFVVASTFDAAVDTCVSLVPPVDAWCTAGIYGDVGGFAASMMPLDEAFAFIQQCLSRYEKQGAP